MVEPLYRQLLHQARRLARLDRMRPKQGNLRRAVSSAYYALFHFLADQTCRMVLGSANDQRPFRDILARAFQHDTMVGACKSFAGTMLPKNIQNRLPAGFTVPTDLQTVANMFREVQEMRHLADYDPAQDFLRAEVLALVRDVEEAINLFRDIRTEPASKFFLICLLSWETLSHRK